ncbi:MAG: hypothetical protein V1916_02315, partial [Patescibacteria group bacterium]
IVAQALLYLSVAYFAQVTTFFIKPQLTRRVFWVFICAAAVGVALSIIFFNYPQYNAATGVTVWNIHPAVSVASIVLLAGVLVPSALYFLWHGIRAPDRIVKVRSVTIGVGILSLVVTAGLYYAATTATLVIVSDFFSLLSFLIIFFGVIYKRSSRLTVSAGTTN